MYIKSLKNINGDICFCKRTPQVSVYEQLCKTQLRKLELTVWSIMIVKKQCCQLLNAQVKYKTIRFICIHQWETQRFPNIGQHLGKNQL